MQITSVPKVCVFFKRFLTFSDSGDYHDEFGQQTEELLLSGREESNPITDELEQHLAEGQDESADTTRSMYVFIVLFILKINFSQEQEGEDDGLTAQLTGMSLLKTNLFKNKSLEVWGDTYYLLN